jgi:subtilase family serine protease
VKLDIDMAMAMVPGLDSVIVHEGCTDDEILQRMAHPVNGVLPKQLSASWSIPTDQNAQQSYLQMAASGQSFLWAVGDHNTTCPVPVCPGANCGQNVRATMPDVTSVGGTVLQMSNNGAAWQSETAAQDGGGILVGFPNARLPERHSAQCLQSGQLADGARRRHGIRRWQPQRRLDQKPGQ